MEPEPKDKPNIDGSEEEKEDLRSDFLQDISREAMMIIRRSTMRSGKSVVALKSGDSGSVPFDNFMSMKRSVNELGSDSHIFLN